MDKENKEVTFDRDPETSGGISSPIMKNRFEALLDEVVEFQYGSEESSDVPEFVDATPLINEDIAPTASFDDKELSDQHFLQSCWGSMVENEDGEEDFLAYFEPPMGVQGFSLVRGETKKNKLKSKNIYETRSKVSFDNAFNHFQGAKRIYEGEKY
ncbi:unnamed protein product [Vicia faba]|uniref:Uncharacterized protein n=1 Tax=Vicia faba TaxID=3906 RepID=A0AAV1AK28_VICFA|nr:unnamed protein product [Vicia faba]